VIIPNTSTFLPIQEVSNETKRKTMNMVEIREPNNDIKPNHIKRTEQY
jgi:hypothetical protein